jgi:hypothetical protein
VECHSPLSGCHSPSVEWQNTRSDSRPDLSVWQTDRVDWQNTGQISLKNRVFCQKWRFLASFTLFAGNTNRQDAKTAKIEAKPAWRPWRLGG